MPWFLEYENGESEWIDLRRYKFKYFHVYYQYKFRLPVRVCRRSDNEIDAVTDDDWLRVFLLTSISTKTTTLAKLNSSCKERE